MSDESFNNVLYTADPTATPAVSEYFSYMKADENGALWIRPLATLGAGIGVQTSRAPTADALAGAGVVAFDVAAFNYIYDEVNGVWDRERRFTSADNMPDIEARSVISFSMGYDGTDWDRLRALADNADAVAVNTAGILASASRLYGFNGATFDRIRSGANNADGVITNATGIVQTNSYQYVYNGTTYDRAQSGADSTDAQATTTTGVQKVLSRLTGFNGATWDRIKSFASNTDAIATNALGLIGALCHSMVFNGTDWMRDWKNADFNAVTSSNVGAASTSLLAASVTRKYLLIQNTHASQILYINFGAAASTSTLAIAAGGSYEPLIIPTDEIFGYGSGATTTYVIVRA